MFVRHAVISDYGNDGRVYLVHAPRRADVIIRTSSDMGERMAMIDLYVARIGVSSPW
jgi:hypothetical protein